MTDPDLTDELNPQHELASAYLDGVASQAERALVEASPELLTLVAFFATVRARVADVPLAADATREAAFVAAFAEFGEPALVPTPAGAEIIPLSAKRRWARPVLSVAAAVLLVGAVGVAAKGALSGDDSDSSSANMDSSAKVASPEAASESQMTTDTMAAMTPATIGYIGGSAEAALVIDTPEQLQALALTAMANADTLPPSTPTELTSSMGDALGCLNPQQEFLADIQYQGTFAIAAHDTVTGMISAIADDCTVLAVVGP